MGKRTIMIIEEDVLHMKVFSDVLENQVYTTLRARDGKVAMDIARLTIPDMIILDIRLPFTSVFDIIKQLKEFEHLKDIPVIAVAALDDETKKDEYLRQGIDVFLTKPISIPNFIKTVAGFFSRTLYAVQ